MERYRHIGSYRERRPGGHIDQILSSVSSPTLCNLSSCLPTCDKTQSERMLVPSIFMLQLPMQPLHPS